MSDSTMYKMKPVFNFPATFKHTSSMYKLKNLQFTRSGEFANFVSQDNLTSENSELIFDENAVLSRQEKLLDAILKLKDQIKAFRVEVEKLKASKSTADKSTPDSTSTCASNTENDIDCKKLISDIGSNDIVINADPKYPPYALLGLTEIWKRLPLKVSIHIHSSVSMLPPHLKIFDNLKNLPENDPKINLTLVWKDVGEDCQIIISPVKSKLILGEVNLLRFFNHYVKTKESVAEKITIDNILDISHQLNHVSNQKKSNLIKELGDILGNKNWFDDKKPTIADVSVWSSFMRIKRKENVPQNLSKFIEKCSAFLGVA